MSVKPVKVLSRTVMAAAVAAAFALSGCGAGQVSQTDTMVAAVPGTSDTRVDSDNGINIAVRNVMVQFGGLEGYPVGGDAPLVARIFNDGTKSNKLIDVTVSEDVAADVTLAGGQPPADTEPDTNEPADGDGTGSEEPAGGDGTDQPGTGDEPAAPLDPNVPAFDPIDLPAGGFQLLVPEEGRFLQLTDLQKPLKPGDVVTVTFVFDSGDPLTLSIPVEIPMDPVDRAPADDHGNAPEGE